jgi:hypothetical protein
MGICHSNVLAPGAYVVSPLDALISLKFRTSAGIGTVRVRPSKFDFGVLPPLPNADPDVEPPRRADLAPNEDMDELL